MELESMAKMKWAAPVAMAINPNQLPKSFIFMNNWICNVAALVGCFGSLGSMTSNWLISSRISHTASAKCFSLEIRQANYTARHQPLSLYSQHNCAEFFQQIGNSFSARQARPMGVAELHFKLLTTKKKEIKELFEALFWLVVMWWTITRCPIHYVTHPSGKKKSEA